MRDIEGYEGLYAVTSCGKVWSYRNKKFLKQYKKESGYYVVNLYKNKERKTKRVHALVAEAYIPNPDNLETVDHIDGNKEHNYIRNLQWMTRGDNVRKSCCKKVRCIETGQTFNSIKEAAEIMRLDPSHIGKVCNGKLNKTGGYHWEVI